MNVGQLIVASCFCVFAFCGCSQQPQVDRKAQFDRQVHEHYFKEFGQADAIELLSGNGIYVDSDEPDTPKLDRLHVLPLLKRLQADFGMQPIAVTAKRDPDLILAVVAELPEGISVEDVQDMLYNVEEIFPGEILQHWGNKWLSLDFLNEQEIRDLEGV